MYHCEFRTISQKEQGQRSLIYNYETDHYYDLKKERSESGWSFSLTKTPLGKKLRKTSQSDLFKDFVENSMVFQILEGGNEVGVMHLGYDEWNRRLRIWDLLVHPEFRGKKFGSQMIDRALEEAKGRGARMVVLETQSCNGPAIDFYLKNGFDLIGFDSLHYSNKDVAKGEIRVELGRILD